MEKGMKIRPYVVILEGLLWCMTRVQEIRIRSPAADCTLQAVQLWLWNRTTNRMQFNRASKSKQLNRQNTVKVTPSSLRFFLMINCLYIGPSLMRNGDVGSRSALWLRYAWSWCSEPQLVTLIIYHLNTTVYIRHRLFLQRELEMANS